MRSRDSLCGMAETNPLFTLATSCAVGAFTLLGVWLNDLLQKKREREKRRNEFRDRLRDERRLARKAHAESRARQNVRLILQVVECMKARQREPIERELRALWTLIQEEHGLLEFESVRTVWFNFLNDKFMRDVLNLPKEETEPQMEEMSSSLLAVLKELNEPQHAW